MSENTGQQDEDVGRLDYLSDANKCKEFMLGYEQDHGDRVKYKYKEMLQDIANHRRKTLDIDLNDVIGFAPDSDEFVERIMENANRYLSMFATVADEIMPDASDRTMLDTDPDDMTVQDILWKQRKDLLDAYQQQREQQQQQQQDGEDGEDNNNENNASTPIALMRRFEVTFIPPAKLEAVSLRTIRANDIGRMVRIRGIVTRVSDVKPQITLATFSCDVCGFESYQEVAGCEFTPISECESPVCQNRRPGGRLYMQTRLSKLIQFQEIKIQESPDQVPIGHIPRTMVVHARGNATRQCSPGDSVDLVGVFLPVAVNAYRQMQIGLVYNTYVECLSIDRKKKSYKELSASENCLEMQEEIDTLTRDSEIYEKLAKSIAPEIFGHLDIKKALLLQLVGGVTRKMRDGMSIRGDINVCLMGDPGVAKSQLLKHIASIAPRGVYTTGKGSSGVGLTAAVIRDKTTSEIALEGGALVLADMGICCIDEFDKMEEQDRTAIHEVMEQQTVSIAKAGVTTTLNARTSILAAANPKYGRYNTKVSIAENVDLPAALLSRFDLLFLVLDKVNKRQDEALARHVTHVHRFSTHPELSFTPIRAELLRTFIAETRNVTPCIPSDLADYVVNEYVTMRSNDHDNARNAKKESLMTARQLLSILRMAQALCRLRFEDEVRREDVEEAIRLIKTSKASILPEFEDDDEDDAENSGGQQRRKLWDLISTVFKESKKDVIKYAELESRVRGFGYSADALCDTLERYQQNNIIHVNAQKTTITLV